MDGTKSLLTSRTFWGAALMMVASGLSFFGIDFGAEEQSRLAYALTELAGFAVAVWGRIAATKQITTPGKGTAALSLLGVMLATSLTLPACALKGLPPHEQALVITSESITAYEALHAEYLHLHASLPEQRAFLEAQAAPALDLAKAALVALGDATALWARTQVAPEDWDGLRTRAVLLLTDAGALLARAHDAHGGGSHDPD